MTETHNENQMPNSGFITAVFSSEHYPNLFEGKQTDDPTFDMICQMARHTTDHDLMRRVIESGLPDDYVDGDGDTLERLDDMIERIIAEGYFEENTSAFKKNAAMIMIELVEASGAYLFRSKMQEAYIKFNDEPYVTRLGMTRVKRKMQYMYREHTGRPINSESLKIAIQELEAVALFEGEEKDVYLRLAPFEDKVILNLCHEDGSVISIDADRHEVIPVSPVMFCPAPGMRPLPLPVKPPEGSDPLRDFQELMSLSDESFKRVLAFIISCLSPCGPYICLLAEGQQGSGKSLLCEFIKTLIDEAKGAKLRLPHKEDDLMILAKGSQVMLFDNVSDIKDGMSDSLCTLSTGGGLGKRKLYTDDETVIFEEVRPFILNGISAYATRPDLLERSMSLNLEGIPKGERKSERELRAEFEKIRPYLLYKLCDIVSCALSNIDKTEAPTEVRMADAGRWLIAAEPATGLPEGSLINSLIESQEEIVRSSLERDSLAMTISKVVSEGAFNGTVGQLFDAIQRQIGDGYDRSMPQTPAHLSKRLDRLAPALANINIKVEFGPKHKIGRLIRVYREDVSANSNRADGQIDV